jgi:hypothetical protein
MTMDRVIGAYRRRFGYHRDRSQPDRIIMGQLRTANKRHNRAIAALQAQKKAVEIERASAAKAAS